MRSTQHRAIEENDQKAHPPTLSVVRQRGFTFSPFDRRIVGVLFGEFGEISFVERSPDFPNGWMQVLQVCSGLDGVLRHWVGRTEAKDLCLQTWPVKVTAETRRGETSNMVGGAERAVNRAILCNFRWHHRLFHCLM